MGVKELGLIFVSIGVLIILTIFIRRFIKKRKCILAINALPINPTYDYSKTGFNVIPRYSYKYNNKEYIYQEQGGAWGHFFPKIGEHITIYINPNKPHEVFFRITIADITNIFFGIIFIIMGLIMFFLT